jgi:hypothetical protein
VSIATARSLPLPAAAERRPEGMGPLEPATGLSRREATVRSAATACLVGIALLQVVELPSLFIRPWELAVLSVAATALCVATSLALAAGPASSSRQLWRVVAATAVLVLAGWAVPHAVALPETGPRGDWTAMPAGACAALAAICLVLAASAPRPTPATGRGVATALAVVLALAPGVGTLLVALGPGPAGGETSLAADVHVHAHLLAGESDIRFRPGPKGNHYVTPVTTPPHQPAIEVALVVAAAIAFVGAAIVYLRRRSAPAWAMPAPGLEGRPA